MYTDPSGEFVFSLFLPGVGSLLDAACWGAVIGGAGYTASVAFSSSGFNNWSWKDFGKSVGIGAISGVATFGIGEAFGAVGSNGLLGEVGRAYAHGISNGAISYFSGGDFWQGFASGGLSSLAGSGFMMYGGDFANSTAGNYLFSSGMGGIGSVLTGGNFFEGAAIGAMNAGLNHLQHKAKLFSNKIAGYNALWETSLDANGNFERETAGWELKDGRVLMLPNDKNSMYKAEIDKPIFKNGKFYAMHEGNILEISTSVHTHKTANSILSGRLSGRDINMINLLGRPINILTPSSIYSIGYIDKNLGILYTIPR
jgi:hypothetical protein